MAAIIPPKKAFVTVGTANADYITTGTNDHTTINNAIDAVSAAGGGIVFLKAGTYTLPNSSTGYILMKSNVTLQGAGINKTVLVGGTTELSNNSTSVGVITTAAQSGAGASTSKTTHLNMVIKDMTIKPYNGGYGITCYNITGLKIENVETFTPTSSPTLIKAGIQIRFGANVSVNNCYVHDTHGNGININGVDYFYVTNNLVKNTYDDGIDIDFDFGDTNSVKSRYGVVSGNKVDTITEAGNCIRVENCDYVTVANNYVTAGSPTNAGVGIWVGNYNVASVTCTNITVVNNHVYNCKTIGIQTESDGNASGATVANILIQGNIIEDCGANSGTDIRGGIVHAAQVATGTRVRILNNTIDGVARTGSDAGGIVIYKKGNVDVLDNDIRDAANGIVVWNGSNAETYSNIYIENNTNTATSAYPNQNNALTQSGVILRKRPTASETYEVSKADAASTTQGYFRGFNPAWPNAWAGWEIKTAGGGDQTDLIGYTGYGTAGEAVKFNAETKRPDFNSDSIRVVTSKTPASASATGTQGQIAWDSSYIYVCTATNTWKRAALSTW